MTSSDATMFLLVLPLFSYFLTFKLGRSSKLSLKSVPSGIAEPSFLVCRFTDDFDPGYEPSHSGFYQEPERFLTAWSWKRFKGNVAKPSPDIKTMTQQSYDVTQVFSRFMKEEFPHVQWFVIGGALNGILRNERLMPFDRDVDVYMDPYTWFTEENMNKLRGLPGAETIKDVASERCLDGCIYVPVGRYLGRANNDFILVMREDFDTQYKFRVVDMASGRMLDGLVPGYQNSTMTIGESNQFLPAQPCTLNGFEVMCPRNPNQFLRSIQYTRFDFSRTPPHQSLLFTRSMPGCTCSKYVCPDAHATQRSSPQSLTSDALVHVFLETDPSTDTFTAYEAPVQLSGCQDMSAELPAAVNTVDIDESRDSLLGAYWAGLQLPGAAAVARLETKSAVGGGVLCLVVAVVAVLGIRRRRSRMYGDELQEPNDGNAGHEL